ncbi:hypothetical protein Tco_1556673 [Tanacetum coccineum]
MIFGHDNLLCLKRAVDKPKKQHTTYNGFQQPPRHTFHGNNMRSKVQYKPKKQVYQVVAKKTGSDDELGSNGGYQIQMLDGKLVLVGDDGKPLKPCKSMLPSSSNVTSKKVNDPVNEDSDDEGLKVYNETATFMAYTNSNVSKASKSRSGGGHKSLCEQ